MLDIPHKAGLLLDKGLADGQVSETADNLEYLSETWIAAREWQKAESALQRAAERSERGDLWQRLAQVQMEQENWSAAQASMSRAISAGVEDVGQASYLLGIAAYNAGDVTGAKHALMTSVRQPSSRQQAQQWLDHLEHEARNILRAKRLQEFRDSGEG
jgi:tetratricopeptide (TPR) repeat protein